MDVYREKNLKPMLIGAQSAPFSHEDFIYELKLDGVRCLAYLNPANDSGETNLRNRRGVDITMRFPELTGLHNHVCGNSRIIVDGELVVAKSNALDFEAIKGRVLSLSPARIARESRLNPAVFVAFDLLYEGSHNIMELPLLQRRERLEANLVEGGPIAISRIVSEQGERFFNAARDFGLEGIVAKRSSSIYLANTRTKNWIKIKNIHDDDFIICGYKDKHRGRATLVLAQNDERGMLHQTGHVALAVSHPDYASILAQPMLERPAFCETVKQEGFIWIIPKLVCVVSFLNRTAGGFLRQPVYKGLRSDKTPQEVVLPLDQKSPINVV